MEHVISLTSGAMYGFTSVLVGQPFDTVKTTMQAVQGGQQTSMIATGRHIVNTHGPFALYRGGIPPIVGGAFFRSCQFTFYNGALKMLRESNLPQGRVCYVDYQVVLAGCAGGFGRGIAEGPFDYIKVRQQVKEQWRFSEMYKGTGITMMRNIGLFAMFAFNIDMSKQLTGGEGLSPFWTGAICANLAWLSIWPLDVVKSRAQSGLHEGKGFVQHLSEAARTGALFRGLVPGLIRSTFANGCAMVVYKKVRSEMEEYFDVKTDAASI